MFISLQNSIIQLLKWIFLLIFHHHSNFRVKYNIHLYNGNFRTQKSGFNCYTAYWLKYYKKDHLLYPKPKLIGVNTLVTLGHIGAAKTLVAIAPIIM